MLRKIAHSEKGAVAIIVGITLALLVGILLLTVDLGRQQNSKFNTQGAADSAALSVAQYITQQKILTGSIPTSAQYLPFATNAFKGNANADEDMTKFDPSSLQVTINAAQDMVTVTGCHITQLKFKTDEADATRRVCSSASANIGKFSNAEIVFALDVSASMRQPLVVGGSSQPKMQYLQNAAATVITEMRNSFGNGSNVIPDVYWGVVPFRGMVDLGVYGPQFTASDYTASAANLLNNERAYESAPDVPANILNDPGLQAKLARVPLTQRTNESGSTASHSDAPPTGSNKFKAYWHHPYDYWFYWNGEASCGLCKQWPQTYDVWTTELVGEQTACALECKKSILHRNVCVRLPNGSTQCGDACECLIWGNNRNCGCGQNYQPPEAGGCYVTDPCSGGSSTGTPGSGSGSSGSGAVGGAG